jgi:hypothetical protein
MTTHTLGTITANALTALTNWNTNGISVTDIAAMSMTLVGDKQIGAKIAGGQSFGATASVCTGTTANASSTLASVTQISSTLGVPVTQIQVGDLIIGRGIPLGTFVAVAPGLTSTVVMSNNATTSSASTGLVFVRVSNTLAEDLIPSGNFSQGLLHLPGGRGEVKVLAGDIVAVDNTGWPILLSGATVAYSSSVWSIV